MMPASYTLETLPVPEDPNVTLRQVPSRRMAAVRYSAVRAAFRNIPETLLREHYRCHPKIIQFCNQKFYENELLVMTRDQDESDVLKAYMTVEGRHARGTINQRQIDEILENVLPELASVEPGDIGIVL